MIGVAAINKLGYVGLNNGLPWKCSADLKFFKKLTTGGTIVMGRKTWEGLPKKPLPGRNNVILKKGNFDYILSLMSHENPIFVLGGPQTWCSLSPYIDTFFISRINDETVGDIKFPPELLEAYYKKITTQSIGTINAPESERFMLEVWVSQGEHNRPPDTEHNYMPANPNDQIECGSGS